MDVVYAALRARGVPKGKEEARFAAVYGRRLADLTPEKALAVMDAADRAAAGMSVLPEHGARYSYGMLRAERTRRA